MSDRNLDQYWVFWPREAASKGINSGTSAMKGEWDKAFNLTTSYRRDSDVPRPFGDANSALQDARYYWVSRFYTNSQHAVFTGLLYYFTPYIIFFSNDELLIIISRRCSKCASIRLFFNY